MNDDNELMLDVGQANELKLALRRAGYNNQEVKSLCEGDILAQFRQVVIGNAEIVQVKLLEFIGTMSILARAESFDPQKEFVLNTSDDAEVKISYMGDNAKAWLPIKKIEASVAGFEVRVQKLLKGSVDSPIIAEHGGSLKARITRGQLWAILKEKQSKGEKDGWHVVYVEDEVRFPKDEPFSYTNEKGEKAVLRAVDFHWGDGGWYLLAYHISHPSEWRAGLLLLSSNSSNS